MIAESKNDETVLLNIKFSIYETYNTIAKETLGLFTLIVNSIGLGAA